MSADRLDGIRLELMAESAHTLGVVTGRMVAALRALAEHDGGGGGERDGGGGSGGGVRAALLEEAAERVWYFVIQREAMGWRDTEVALAVYDVPAEVRARMGARRVGGG